MRYIPLYHSDIVQSPEKFDEYFTVNKQLLYVLTDSIQQESPDSIPQPRIIIGAEGSGKTWLLHALKYKLDKDTSYKVTLCEGSQFQSGEQVIKTFSDVSVNKDKRPVILIDNLNLVLNMMSNDEQYQLRGMLNKNGAPILVGTASSLPKALSDYTAAFFDGFAIHNIGSISENDTIAILELKNERQENRAKILLSIVGTTIRNIQLVRNIIAVSSSAETDGQILLDYLYPPMQLKLSSFPPLSRQIITAAAKSEDGLLLSELSAKLKIAANRISPYVTKLVKDQVLIREGASARKATYLLADKRLKFFIEKTTG